MKFIRVCFCLLFLLGLFSGERTLGYGKSETEELTDEETEIISMLDFLENYEVLQEEIDFLDNYEVLGEEDEEKKVIF